MPKTVTVRSSGGDATTIQGAINLFNSYDFAGGPSYIDIYKEGGGTDGEWVLTGALTGPTSPTNMSSTNQLIIRAVSGSSFKDNANKLTNALRYNPANGVAIRQSGTSATHHIINTAIPHIVFEGLQIQGGSAGNIIATGSGNVAFTMRNCIVKGVGNRCLSNTSVGDFRFINNVIVDAPILITGTAAGGPHGYVIGNTCYTATDPNAWGSIRISSGPVYVSDNICYAPSANDINLVSSGTLYAGSGYNALSDASNSATGTVQNLTMSDLFENLGSGTEDFRLKSTCPSAVKAGGQRENTYTSDLDILGQSRSTTTPSIGAHEYVAVALGIPKTTKFTMLGVG